MHSYSAYQKACIINSQLVKCLSGDVTDNFLVLIGGGKFGSSLWWMNTILHDKKN